jgi:NADH-quinone oxidoreductase subunit L
MAGVLDMREMSGLRKVLPWTNRFILVGCLALAGVPLFSGFFSKDEIVAAALGKSWVLGGVLLLTAFLTAYYTFRLYFRVFQGPLVVPEAPAGHGHGHADAHGAPDAHAVASASAVQTGDVAQSGVDEHLAKDTAHHGHAVADAHGHGGQGHGDHHNHEPLSMMLPLAVLTIGAFAAGYLNWPERHASLGGFLGTSPSFELGYNVNTQAQPGHFGLHGAAAGEHPLITPVMLVSAFISLLGVALAYALHLRDRARAERLAAGLAPLTRTLEAKYWVDEIYQAAIVEPLRTAGRGFFWIDRFIVDGLVNLFGWVPGRVGSVLQVTMQRGYLQGYAAAMLFGIEVIMLIIFL